jgi:hypothetical protein
VTCSVWAAPFCSRMTTTRNRLIGWVALLISQASFT